MKGDRPIRECNKKYMNFLCWPQNVCSYWPLVFYKQHGGGHSHSEVQQGITGLELFFPNHLNSGNCYQLYNGVNVSTILNKNNCENKHNAAYCLKNFHETFTHKIDLTLKR